MWPMTRGRLLVCPRRRVAPRLSSRTRPPQTAFVSIGCRRCPEESDVFRCKPTSGVNLLRYLSDDLSLTWILANLRLAHDVGCRNQSGCSLRARQTTTAFLETDCAAC